MANKWTTLTLRAKTPPEHRATHLQTAQEMIAAIRQERVQETLATIRRAQTQQTIESERKKLAVPSVPKFDGLAAEVWQQPDVPEYLNQERASWDENDALPESKS